MRREHKELTHQSTNERMYGTTSHLLILPMLIRGSSIVRFLWCISLYLYRMLSSYRMLAWNIYFCWPCFSLLSLSLSLFIGPCSLLLKQECCGLLFPLTHPHLTLSLTHTHSVYVCFFFCLLAYHSYADQWSVAWIQSNDILQCHQSSFVFYFFSSLHTFTSISVPPHSYSLFSYSLSLSLSFTCIISRPLKKLCLDALKPLLLSSKRPWMLLRLPSSLGYHFLYLSLSITPTHTHYTHTLFLVWHTHTLTHTASHAPSLFLSLCLTHSDSLHRSLSLSHTHTHTLTHTDIK